MNKVVLLLFATLFWFGISLFFQGPVPGDVEFTIAVQILFNGQMSWAQLITTLAKLPDVILPLVFMGLYMWKMEQKKGVMTLGLSFLTIKGVDFLLRAVINVPRPDNQLVYVATESSSSGLPSSFALVWGVLMACLFLPVYRQNGIARVISLSGVVVFLIVGLISRVAPGAHWPSQMIASFCLAFLVTAVIRKKLIFA